MRDAQRRRGDELIPSSPCVLKDELPAKRDKDRTWRRTAVFMRDEVEAIISSRRRTTGACSLR